jgi:hypothetical protein
VDSTSRVAPSVFAAARFFHRDFFASSKEVSPYDTAEIKRMVTVFVLRL